MCQSRTSTKIPLYSLSTNRTPIEGFFSAQIKIVKLVHEMDANCGHVMPHISVKYENNC
jgi:hypothetical protein